MDRVTEIRERWEEPDTVRTALCMDAVAVCEHAQEDIAYLLSEIERLWNLLAETGDRAPKPDYGSVSDLKANEEVWIKGEA